MESAEASRAVIKLDDYRQHYDDEYDRLKLLADLAVLADCILTAAEILSRISLPPQ